MDILYAVLILGGVGLVSGLLLGVASKYLVVEEDPRFAKLVELLPGYNCGACGTPGCNAMAGELLNENINVSACKPAKKAQLEEIKKYLESTPGADGTVVKVKM